MLIDNFEPSEFRSELENIELTDVLQFKTEMLENFRFTTLFTGNVLRSEADEFVHTLKSTLNLKSSHAKTHHHDYDVLNIQGNSFVYPMMSMKKDPTDLNAVTLNYYQIGHRDKKSYAIMQLLSSTLRNRAFNYLRTEL